MKEPKKYPFNGEMLTMHEIAKRVGQRVGTTRTKYSRGWDGTPLPGWGLPKPKPKEDDAYTEEELYSLFKGFAGNFEEDEELVMLSDFMDKDLTNWVQRKLVEETLVKFRNRLSEERT